MKVTKAKYRLSNDVVATCRSSVWWDLRNEAKWLLGANSLRGEERAKCRARIRNLIAAYRALEGYSVGIGQLSFNQAVTRGMTKKQRRWWREWRTEKRKEKAGTP